MKKRVNNERLIVEWTEIDWLTTIKDTISSTINMFFLSVGILFTIYAIGYYLDVLTHNPIKETFILATLATILFTCMMLYVQEEDDNYPKKTVCKKVLVRR